jgi:hypothetical protein
MRSEQSKMRKVPFWIDIAPIQKFSRLQRNISVDIVVVWSRRHWYHDYLSLEKSRIKLAVMIV